MGSPSPSEGPGTSSPDHLKSYFPEVKDGDTWEVESFMTLVSDSNLSSFLDETGGRGKGVGRVCVLHLVEDGKRVGLKTPHSGRD